MKKFIKKIFFFFLLIHFAACKQAGEEKAVLVKNAGVFNPVELIIEGGEDKGEFLVGSDAVVFTIRVINTSSYDLTEAQLILDEQSTASMKFTPNADNKSLTPGFGGTCSTIIRSDSECVYKLTYTPSFPGELSQLVTFRYKNLVDQKEIAKTMTMIAGEAASLIFKSDKTSYDFGVKERTEREKIVQVMDIKNAGGLTARNIIFSQINVPDSGAYSILENTCPSSLKASLECRVVLQFEPQNYDVAAPDGAVEVDYTSNLKFEYVRDPLGGMSALNAYFFVKSTTIEGNIKHGGLKDVEFGELTVGNSESKIVKIQNQGYKEAIIHRIDVLDASENIIASCVKTIGGPLLECRDPSDVLNPASALSVAQLPLTINDNSSCLSPVDQMSYTRDAGGVLSDLSLVQVAGKTPTLPGASCFFNLRFKPSVTYLANGHFNDYKLRFVYDSTWKNQIVIKGDQSGDEHQFNFKRMQYLSAAKLSVSEFIYGVDTFTDFHNTDDGLFKYDLGRVALISNAAYKKPFKITFKNNGSTLAQIISIKDANASPFTFSEFANDINNYYRSASHVNCTYLAPVAGQCDIKFDLAPLASALSDGVAAQNQENGWMYDVIGSYPERYKKFIVEYKDGASVEDDGSPRANRKIEVWVRSLLVRKGYLVFEDTSSTQGTAEADVSGNTRFFHVKLKNVGTGGIPYIKIKSGMDLLGTSEKASDQPYPYEIVNRVSAEAGATKDCFDIVTFDGSTPAVMPPNTNAPSILDADQTCSLTVKMKLRSTDVFPNSGYGSSTPDWERFFDSTVQNTTDAWEESTYNRPTPQDLSFEYYDGDGIEDIANGYTPDLNGHGNFYQIAGGTFGVYKINVNFRRKATLIPTRPTPMVTSVLCREALTLPQIIPTAEEWGATVGSAAIVETCTDFHTGIAVTPVSYVSLSMNDIKSGYSGYDFIYYAGTYKIGTSYKFSFSIKNSGSIAASSVSESLTPMTGLSKLTNLGTSIGNGSSKVLDFNFTPSISGRSETDYVVTYTNGKKNLTDVDLITYSETPAQLRVKIIVDVVDSDQADFSLTAQDYLVTYDKFTDTIDDTTPIAGIQSFNLFYNESDLAQFVRLKAIRGSKVYAKKVLTFTNTSAATVSDVRFNIKASADAAALQNTKGGAGYLIASNGCNGSSLAPAQTCLVILHHKAGLAEPLETAVHGNLTYELGSNSYQQRNVQIKFIASDPAILSAQGIAKNNIYDESNNIIQGAFPLSLGTYTTAHPILNNFPTHRASKNSVTIVNQSTEKASFLKQWEDYSGGLPLPAGSWIEIYNQDGKIVEANRACFFGDDELDGAIGADQKGFMTTTISPCRMNFHYDLTDNYLGKMIDTRFSYVRLKFYNNERASEDEIYLYFDGFIEPNKSSASNTIFNVTTTESKTISFEWNDATPVTASWGDVVGYRVFYSATINPLNNVFQNAVTFVDTVDPQVTISSGLSNARYYYIRVFAKRVTQSGKAYISDMGMTTKTVIVPPAGWFYDYAMGILVNKSPITGQGTKAQAISACDAKTTVLSRNGSSISPRNKLINSSIYALIDSDPSNSNYSYKAIPHWMSDSPVDIAPIFAPTFECASPTGTNGSNTFYSKSCADCSCNILSLIIGGDGNEIPYGAYLYTGDSMTGIYRCYVTQ